LTQLLGEQGRADREQRFTWRQVVARVETVYESLLDRAARA